MNRGLRAEHAGLSDANLGAGGMGAWHTVRLVLWIRANFGRWMPGLFTRRLGKPHRTPQAERSQSNFPESADAWECGERFPIWRLTRRNWTQLNLKRGVQLLHAWVCRMRRAGSIFAEERVASECTSISRRRGRVWMQEQPYMWVQAGTRCSMLAAGNACTCPSVRHPPRDASLDPRHEPSTDEGR